MNNNILNTVIQDFINYNLDVDITKLLLQNPKFTDVSIKEIVEQIEAKKKCKTKLPTWYSTNKIYYPNKLNIAQSSSEITAKYKASLVSGKSLMDLTGGFGVDAYYFSKKVQRVIHCDIDKTLTEIVRHNYDILNVDNIDTLHVDGIAYLKSVKEKHDWIYLDPSRRHDIKGKVFFLRDCLPNITGHLDDLFEKSDNIIIKTSPLLDIKAGLEELHSVSEIHVIAMDNDVKELLWVLKKGCKDPIKLKTINIKKNSQQVFDYYLEDETKALATYSHPLLYLYEPNSAILKSGAFKQVSQTLNIAKLHVNSHLYTSNELVDFPGRQFKIDRILPYNKKLLKKEFLFDKANISTRNFPESVEQLKKKFNLGDGGTIYLFFTTDVNEQRIVLVCSKV